MSISGAFRLPSIAFQTLLIFACLYIKQKVQIFTCLGTGAQANSIVPLLTSPIHQVHLLQPMSQHCHGVINIMPTVNIRLHCFYYTVICFFKCFSAHKCVFFNAHICLSIHPFLPGLASTGLICFSN